MTEDRIVAVTGATGRQGRAVTRHLLADGWQVRALTRKPDSAAARDLSERGAVVTRIDMMKPDTLSNAFRDAYAVYSVQNPMTSGLEAEIVQGKNVADAAKRAGVQHVVYGSAGVGVPGTGVGSWESKLEVQRHMEGLGLSMTVFRPMAFMELMTDKSFFPAVSTWHVMPKLMGGERPVVWLCLDDLGAIAARVLAQPDRFVGADLPLAGDVKSIDECRAIWREVTGRAPRRLPMPVWMFERFVGTDLPTMWRWLRTGHVDLDLTTARDILAGVRGVRAWLEQASSRRP